MATLFLIPVSCHAVATASVRVLRFLAFGSNPGIKGKVKKILPRSTSSLAPGTRAVLALRVCR